MRTIIFAAALGIILLSGYSYAQEVVKSRGTTYVGPVAGIGNSWVANLPGTADFKTTGYLGVGMVKMSSTHWAWGGQLALSSEGYQLNFLNSVQKVTPIYLRMPMRVYYFFGRPGYAVRPELYLGPSFGMKVAEHSSTSNYYNEVYMTRNTENFRRFDAGIDGGAGLNINLTRAIALNIDLGFYQGITDAVKDAQNTYNPNEDVDLNVGLMFDIR